jgi:ATP-dependent RNA helicase RhlE
MSFSELGLTPSLCTPLAAMGYTQPTPVQLASIPVVLTGADLMARAQTGTGKTAAFALPMIERLVLKQGRARTSHPLGLVLVPTRELAVQVQRAIAKYGASARLRVVPIYGGVGMAPQINALRNGVDIVVATPGRLIDHVQRRTVNLSKIEVLVLDEADRMLDMGFMPALRRLLPELPASRQTLLFSATMPSAVVKLAGDFTRDAQRVDVSNDQAVAPTITHRVHPVDQSRKRALLLQVLTQAPDGQAIVFCKTKHGADRVGELLEGSAVKSAVIHGRKSQGQRTRCLADFKAGKTRVLVATDIAARGLDIVQLPLVVNFDLPLVAEDYIHRVGRTGRAGLAGHAISLVSPDERGLLHDIQKLLSTPLEHQTVEGFESTDTGAGARRQQPRGNRPQNGRRDVSGGGQHRHSARPNAGGFSRRGPSTPRRSPRPGAVN